MNLIELKKADRLGLPQGPRRTWVAFPGALEGEIDTTYEPVRKAMERLKELITDKGTRRLALVRES